MINRALRTHDRLAPLVAVVPVGIALLLAGCGGGGGSSSSNTAAATPSTSSTSTGPTVAGKPSCGSSTASSGASEAASTAQGDIPDNQQFLSFKNSTAGYSISYPEGWARSGNGSQALFRNLGNTITIKVVPGSQPSPASVA